MYEYEPKWMSQEDDYRTDDEKSLDEYFADFEVYDE